MYLNTKEQNLDRQLDARLRLTWDVFKCNSFSVYNKSFLIKINMRCI